MGAVSPIEAAVSHSTSTVLDSTIELDTQIEEKKSMNTRISLNLNIRKLKTTIHFIPCNVGLLFSKKLSHLFIILLLIISWLWIDISLCGLSFRFLNSKVTSLGSSCNLLSFIFLVKVVIASVCVFSLLEPFSIFLVAFSVSDFEWQRLSKRTFWNRFDGKTDRSISVTTSLEFVIKV